MIKSCFVTFLLILLTFFTFITDAQVSTGHQHRFHTASPVGRWTASRANKWYKSQQQWIIGSNYAPAYASNQIEMFSAETFNITAIDRELEVAAKLGMNSMRVFLHNLLWEKDSQGFLERLREFLSVAADKYGIRIMFVLFDSCWAPHPHLGQQEAPIAGVHNSRWVQAPGAKLLSNRTRYPALKEYVQGVVSAFKDDERVLVWDVWNEPDNLNAGIFKELPNKQELIADLLPQVFQWIRDVGPIQPLTSGVWHNDLNAVIPQLQLMESDIISFHQYSNALDFQLFIKRLKWIINWRHHDFKRPIFCTEWLARTVGSTVEAILPVARRLNIAMYNWGLVAGKTQTYYPYDSWRDPYVGGHKLSLWFHDLFNTDLSPYSQAEYDFIQSVIHHHL